MVVSSVEAVVKAVVEAVVELVVEVGSVEVEVVLVALANLKLYQLEALKKLSLREWRSKNDKYFIQILN